MKKIGIYGGSFSPPHNGHISAARQFMDALSLDELLIMPSHISPHKVTDPTLTSRHRYDMAKIAFKDLPRVTVSDYEIQKGDISYTANTLSHFSNEGELYFLCGTDMFLTLSRWYRPDIIFENATIVLASRENGKEEEIIAAKKAYETDFGARIIILNNEVLEISSTEVRQALKQGNDVSRYLSQDVEVYIREHNLYL
ncbi:MAG: nicotinate (nicotinamide) nucleotide adenylyltransferase [Clostridia bacterium]|nr:nicotinate (nicotinamide) nucleotide adenylyltransferase [Clostridia bacterium]